MPNAPERSATVTVDGVTWTQREEDALGYGVYRYWRSSLGFVAGEEMNAALSLIAEQAAELAALRADADAVRAVEQWLKTHGFDRVLVDSFGNLGMFTIGEGKIASGATIPDIGRALIARQQQEGTT
jgi:hypothetical protein